MDKNSRKIAKGIRSGLSIPVSLDEVLKQVKVLESDGLKEHEIKEQVPQILRLHHAKENNNLEDLKERVDRKDIEGIRVESLPDEYDRDDWR